MFTVPETRVLLTSLRRQEAILKSDLEEMYDDFRNRGIDVNSDRVASVLVNKIENDLDLIESLMVTVTE